ncbi:MAG: biotin--[acetyl-CoA-carboxylase] ligase [Chloroflexi bacterium]|nr:biotin--[acetyl-CoA-carboxylase] ligase [Chloroflexota bacterium]
MIPDDLDAARIAEALGPTRLDLRPELRAETGSTMDALADLARAGMAEGGVLLAEHQQAGRGRLGRAWLAPAGTALMLSILFRPSRAGLAPERSGELSMLVGLAAIDALTPRLPKAARLALKWPNDLLAEGSKLAGILAEADWPAAASGPSHVIVGIGINVRQDAAALPEGATSVAALHAALGQAARPEQIDRGLLAVDLLRAVDRRHAALLAGQGPRQEWAARLDTLGRQVRARRGATLIQGHAEGLAEDGALLIRLPDGRLERLSAGDVTLAPASGDALTTDPPDATV